MIEDDLCRSDSLGLSIRERREDGRCDGSSDSEPLVTEDELDEAGEMLGRISLPGKADDMMGLGSGYAAVTGVDDEG